MTAELRALAEAATKGPWSMSWDAEYAAVELADGEDYVIVGTSHEAQNCTDARYIAAANPSAVLALLDRNRELETGLREMVLSFHIFNGRCTTDFPSCQTELCRHARALLTPAEGGSSEEVHQEGNAE